MSGECRVFWYRFGSGKWQKSVADLPAYWPKVANNLIQANLVPGEEGSGKLSISFDGDHRANNRKVALVYSYIRKA